MSISLKQRLDSLASGLGRILAMLILVPFLLMVMAFVAGLGTFFIHSAVDGQSQFGALTVILSAPWVLFVAALFAPSMAEIFRPNAGGEIWLAYGKALVAIWRKLPRVVRLPLSAVMRGIWRPIVFAGSMIKRGAAWVDEFFVVALSWIVGAACLAGLGYVAYIGIAALPLSVAIIVGAVIIATALAKAR